MCTEGTESRVLWVFVEQIILSVLIKHFSFSFSTFAVQLYKSKFSYKNPSDSHIESLN